MKPIVQIAFVLLVLFYPPAAAATSELEERRDRLVSLLTGEFDSSAQMRGEQATNVPEDKVHGHVYRSFIRIKAPKVGEHLLISTVRYGGRDGQFDNGEFQVWTLTVDEERSAVKMAPRRFKTPDDYIENGLNAAAFATLTPDELVPPHGGAACPIHWYTNGDTLRGITDPPCESMSSTMGISLKWEWTYSLDDEGMWLNYTGRNAAGEIVNGRKDRMPWRLDKLN